MTRPTPEEYAKECQLILSHIQRFADGSPKSMVIPNANMPTVERALTAMSRMTEENIAQLLQDDFPTALTDYCSTEIARAIIAMMEGK